MGTSTTNEEKQLVPNWVTNNEASYSYSCFSFDLFFHIEVYYYFLQLNFIKNYTVTNYASSANNNCICDLNVSIVSHSWLFEKDILKN